ncbi:hypothetical protein DACRYDRAFT_108693 [Dacryopinax primogenitus]|uniref:Aminoglycoside phosphotransferase domain-containing protein n=1 Tax=Dacryopinax primogenitus (strain DJM 731) TaxID=1858805 RepID=M5FW84_DACPD|nr:uncharacterized protein DACRYDRAFT_108693 [Dacryopinax primogenitus]EJU00629.1 hypothetical protein DACRYDRAFT_108693 [Dacryopinax primogenitus]
MLGDNAPSFVASVLASEEAMVPVYRQSTKLNKPGDAYHNEEDALTVLASFKNAIPHLTPPCAANAGMWHDDLHGRNILVDPDTQTVTAVLDWSGATSVPQYYIAACPPSVFDLYPENDNRGDEVKESGCAGVKGHDVSDVLSSSSHPDDGPRSLSDISDGQESTSLAGADHASGFRAYFSLLPADSPLREILTDPALLFLLRPNPLRLVNGPKGHNLTHLRRCWLLCMDHISTCQPTDEAYHIPLDELQRHIGLIQAAMDRAQGILDKLCLDNTGLCDDDKELAEKWEEALVLLRAELGEDPSDETLRQPGIWK